MTEITSARRSELQTRFATERASFEEQARTEGPTALELRVAAPAGARPLRGCEPTGTLSGRQTVVLQLVANGLTNQEIGASLIIAPETVKTHIVHILSRLGVRNRAEAVAASFRAGLIA